MRFIKFLILVGVIGFIALWWMKRENSRGLESNKASITQIEGNSPNGFVSVAMPAGAGPNSVLILAPVNCPSDVAKRADALSARLTELRISNRRSSSFSLNIPNPTDAQQAAMKRSLDVLNGGPPAVFLNGMGKSNPSVDEVIAEYERTK